MSNKRKIFITVQKIINQGGISTSILNLLNEIHSLYAVTLCPIEDYISSDVIIPNDVIIIRGSSLIGDAITDRNLLKHQNLFQKIRRSYVRVLRHCKGMDYIVNKGISQIRLPQTEYDVAIAFSGDLYSNGHLKEGGEYKFVSQIVKAKRRVAWVHNDIRKMGYNHEIALCAFKDFDAIATVSSDNKYLVEEMVPEYKNKLCVVYNTHNVHNILIKSKEDKNPFENNGKLHFVTVARLSLSQKRQDRIVLACGRLLREGFDNFDWHLIGSGGERDVLEKMISDEGLSHIIKLVGLLSNPYPYILHADAFVLTSLHEGLPMTVAEAKILGCPVLVTNFGSAHEAVNDGHEGEICDNSSEGVYLMMKSILSSPEKLLKYRQYLKEHPFNNNYALNQFRSTCGL